MRSRARGKRKWTHTETEDSWFTNLRNVSVVFFVCFFNGDALVTDMGASAGLISYLNRTPQTCFSHWEPRSRAALCAAQWNRWSAGWMSLCVRWEQSISVCLPEFSGTRPCHDAVTNATVIPSWYVNVFPKMTSRANLSGLPRWNSDSTTRTNALQPICHVVINTVQL